MNCIAIDNIQNISAIVFASAIALAGLAPIAISFVEDMNSKESSDIETSQAGYNRVRKLLFILFVSTLSSSIPLFLYLYGKCYPEWLFYCLFFVAFCSSSLQFVALNLLIHHSSNLSAFLEFFLAFAKFLHSLS